MSRSETHRAGRFRAFLVLTVAAAAFSSPVAATAALVCNPAEFSGDAGPTFTFLAIFVDSSAQSSLELTTSSPAIQLVSPPKPLTNEDASGGFHSSWTSIVAVEVAPDIAPGTHEVILTEIGDDGDTCTVTIEIAAPAAAEESPSMAPPETALPPTTQAAVATTIAETTTSIEPTTTTAPHPVTPTAAPEAVAPEAGGAGTRDPWGMWVMWAVLVVAGVAMVVLAVSATRQPRQFKPRKANATDKPANGQAKRRVNQTTSPGMAGLRRRRLKKTSVFNRLKSLLPRFTRRSQELEAIAGIRRRFDTTDVALERGRWIDGAPDGYSDVETVGAVLTSVAATAAVDHAEGDDRPAIKDSGSLPPSDLVTEHDLGPTGGADEVVTNSASGRPAAEALLAGGGEGDTDDAVGSGAELPSDSSDETSHDDAGPDAFERALLSFDAEMAELADSLDSQADRELILDATAWVNRFGTHERLAETLAAFGALLARRDELDPGTARVLASLLLDLGSELIEAGHPLPALGVFDQVVVSLQDRDGGTDTQEIGEALHRKREALVALGSGGQSGSASEGQAITFSLAAPSQPGDAAAAPTNASGTAGAGMSDPFTTVDEARLDNDSSDEGPPYRSYAVARPSRRLTLRDRAYAAWARRRAKSIRRRHVRGRR